MATAYSMDLRSRVLRDADAGLSSKQLAERYHVSRAWVDALKQRRRETGDPAPRKQTRWRTPILAGQEARLKALILEQPDRTLRELREALATTASLATIWRAIELMELGHSGQEPGTARFITWNPEVGSVMRSPNRRPTARNTACPALLIAPAW